jgi:hypothetical protein
MSEMFKQLMETTKVADLIEVIEAFGKEKRVAWKPVGDNDNNLAIINLGSDPAAGVIERTTNAIDAIIEHEWIQRGQPPYILSPRAAVEKWWGIKGGQLSNLAGDELRGDYAELAKKVQIVLRDSDRPDKPTVDIRDYGIGLRAEEFKESILSLNKNRKLRKLFLAGAFGQGGSTALAYSPFTVIFSRAVNFNEPPSPVAIIIVRFNPGDPNVDKTVFTNI